MYEIKCPVITLVGQKNVGKSTLFNRLTGTNSALVSHDYSSVTRDRQYGSIVYQQYEFTIVDTGCFDRLFRTEMQYFVNNQTIFAIQEADIILFIVNGNVKSSSIDYEIIDYLRKLKKTIFIVVNKVDHILWYNDKYMVYDYYSLGIEKVIAISAIHGYGIKFLLEQIFFQILENFYNCDKILKKRLLFNNTNAIKLALVGRPNSGKSTFINYILKTNRLITSDIPGTTRDSIHISTIYDDQEYVLIDTAGVRRRKQINTVVEKISVDQTLKILKNVHITLFIIDIHSGLVDQDFSLLKFISNNSKALIIVINKLDTLNLPIIRENIMKSLILKKGFLNFAKVHFISSLCGYGIKTLFKSIKKTYQESLQIISTSRLNRIMHEAMIKYPPPFLHGIRISPKPKYVHIGGYDPIIIIIHGTQVSYLPHAYRKYLKRYFYKSLNMKGIVMHIRFKNTVNPFTY